MSKESIKLKFDSLKTQSLNAKGFEINIRELPVEEWTEEPQGPHPFPELVDLRNWFHTLLKKYPPFYAPVCDYCCLCTFGKCDLSRGKHGACGLTLAAQQARIVALACCIGASCHCGHSRHLVHHLIEKFGRNTPISLGSEIDVEAPVTRTVCGFKPKTLKDLETALDYVETQIMHTVASTHTGQESSALDYEAKAMLVSMCDHVGMEVADIAQISGYDFPKGDEDVPLIETGLGTISQDKPVILMIGHNVASGVEVIDYLKDIGRYGEIETCGICCTILDLTRYDEKSKIVGPITYQLRIVRSGVPDVIMVDEQCIRTDIIEEAKEINAKVIATNEKACHGLPDSTHVNEDELVDKLVNDELDAVLIFDPEKAARIAVKTAEIMYPKRKKQRNLPTDEEMIEIAKKCSECYDCQRACPNNLYTTEAIIAAKEGDFSKLEGLYEACLACGRCEDACPKGIPVTGMIIQSWQKNIRDEKWLVRAGRGPVKDTEIRAVGAPIVLGEIPGIVALIGCGNLPNGSREVAKIAEEFLKRRYIVVATGCSAMDIGRYKTEDGEYLYEKYPGVFDAGGLTNIGSCVSNGHISGAAMKVASIFARRNLRGNFEEIADYILNRVGAVGISWGAMSQKAASIATGFNAMGVPAIVGPHGSKYRRQYLGKDYDEEAWEVIDSRSGDVVPYGPAPENLMMSCETVDEAIVTAAKLCMRPADNFKGRAVKLTHWIDLHKKTYGTMPDDVWKYVRVEADIPLTYKSEIMKILKEKGWKERPIPDPTNLPRLIRKKKE
jgi:acetyl-CoA decarbonylase/synthase complex subunit alpha